MNLSGAQNHTLDYFHNISPFISYHKSTTTPSRLSMSFLLIEQPRNIHPIPKRTQPILQSPTLSHYLIILPQSLHILRLPVLLSMRPKIIGSPWIIHTIISNKPAPKDIVPDDKPSFSKEPIWRIWRRVGQDGAQVSWVPGFLRVDKYHIVWCGRHERR